MRRNFLAVKYQAVKFPTTNSFKSTVSIYDKFEKYKINIISKNSRIFFVTKSIWFKSVIKLDMTEDRPGPF